MNVSIDAKTGDTRIACNVLERRNKASYFHVHGYNFIYFYDKNDTSNTYLFLHVPGKLMYNPFSGNRVTFSRQDA